ncbi:hypothetical protein CW304_00980 [Bacillus sp. UFRGS-B20]|nr:hypothetical protein CW304_00980 [Bacillus sp. UFRGS-B20]
MFQPPEVQTGMVIKNSGAKLQNICKQSPNLNILNIIILKKCRFLSCYSIFNPRNIFLLRFIFD